MTRLPCSFWDWGKGSYSDASPKDLPEVSRCRFIIDSMATGVLDPDVIDPCGNHFIEKLIDWEVSKDLIDDYLSTKPRLHVVWGRILLDWAPWIDVLVKVEALWQDLGVVQAVLGASRKKYQTKFVEAELQRRWCLSLRRLWIQVVVL